MPSLRASCSPNDNSRMVGNPETILKVTVERSSPSMRRPVDVKAHVHLLLSVNQFPFSQAAPVAILPFALFVSDLRSVQGGCSRSVGAAT